MGDSQVFAEDFSADTVSDDFHIGAFRVACFSFVELAEGIYFADNTFSTLNLDFIVEPYFGESVKFSQRIFPPTPFPTTFILELYSIAYFGFVDLAQWIALPTTHFRPLIWSF